METQPGHGASDARGEYTIRRNTIGDVSTSTRVGGTTYGGTGVYGAQIGGVWDALLGEGRNFWFFASSDWHNRGSFGPDDRRTTQDFYPGEYQRDYVMVRDTDGERRRSRGPADAAGDRRRPAHRQQLHVERPARSIAWRSSRARIRPLNDKHRQRSRAKLSTLLAARAEHRRRSRQLRDDGREARACIRAQDIVVSIVVRDPSGTNYSPYTFPNPSLAQVGINQPLNAPVLDHVDVIRGMVTGYKTPGAADYSGQWPSDWLDESNPTVTRGSVDGAGRREEHQRCALSHVQQRDLEGGARQ